MFFEQLNQIQAVSKVKDIIHYIGNYCNEQLGEMIVVVSLLELFIVFSSDKLILFTHSSNNTKT